MKDIKTYNNKNILVLGLGKSGFAVSELLLQLGANLTLNDKNELMNLVTIWFYDDPNESDD